MARANFFTCVLIGCFTLTAGCSSQPKSVFGPVLPSVVSATDGDITSTDGKGPQLIVTSKADKGSGSLRDTLARAKAGSTIVFRLPKRAQISLTTGSVTIAKNVKIVGPGTSLLSISANRKSQLFLIAAHVNATITNLTLRNGNATQGGAIYNGGTLTVDAVAFKGNVAPGGISGGAVIKPASRRPPASRRGGHVVKHPPAPRIAFPHSEAAGAGGAIYNTSHGKLIVSNSIFMNNSAAFGGAIDNAGTAVLMSDTFKGNTGFHGSNSVGAYGYGAALYDSGKANVTSCTFTANVAGGRSDGSYGVGGAIAQASGLLKVVNSIFDSNIAGDGSHGSWGTGGAIYTAAGTLTISGSSFSANAAGGDSYGYGGAIYADQFFSGSKNKFSLNAAFGTASEAGAFGGAVYAGAGLTLANSTFTSNNASGSYAFGGAIDSEANSAFGSDAFSGNVAAGGLGGFAEGGAVYVGSGSNAFTSVTFSTNRASASGASAFSSGGAVAAFGGVSVGGASTLTSNSASVGTGGLGADGGALAVEQGPLALTASIANNTATTQGGGLWVDGTATVTNAMIAGNTVSAMQAANDGGGGVYSAYSGALTITGSTITANNASGAATNAGGGGLFNAGSATITNSTIESNSSSVDGGGMENVAAGNVNLANVTIYLNSASGNGGSLKNLYADASISIANSILAGGLASGGAPNDISNDGSVVSGDYNIIQNAATGSAVTGTTTHNLAVDPQLSPLADNGGPTQTSADGAGSPGRAYVVFNNCLQFNVYIDQRGLPRGATGFCDVGAYENQNP